MEHPRDFRHESARSRDFARHLESSFAEKSRRSNAKSGIIRARSVAIGEKRE
jgi:hypothetical protein